MAIVPATPEDMAAVAAICAHYVDHSVATFDEVAPTIDEWRRKLTDLTGRGFPFLVTRSDHDEVDGYAYVAPWRIKPAYRHTVEDTIYLAPGRTGQGLGRPLLAALLDACVPAGIREVVAVIADTGSDASAALHRAAGFREAGRLTGVGHKHGRWIDTSLMQLNLTLDG